MVRSWNHGDKVLIMEKRLVAKLPDRNKKCLVILGTIMFVVGLISLVIFGTGSIVGRVFLLFGGAILSLLVVVSCRKVEIVGNCGISKAFLKKRLFYLSEVKGVNYFAGGDRMVAYGMNHLSIFETMKSYGNYAEIIEVLKRERKDYVDEPEVENSSTMLRMDTVSRTAVYIGIILNIVGLLIQEYSKFYLIGLGVVVVARIMVEDHFWEKEDYALEENGSIIENAVLTDYLACVGGNAYPIFIFMDKEHKHMVYSSTKMKMKEIHDNLGKGYTISYAPGKASAVKIMEIKNVNSV